MRGVGVGEGLADGTGDGVGVCASELSGALVTTTLAAPRAGNSFTNVRRLLEVFLFSFFNVY